MLNIKNLLQLGRTRLNMNIRYKPTKQTLIRHICNVIGVKKYVMSQQTFTFGQLIELKNWIDNTKATLEATKRSIENADGESESETGQLDTDVSSARIQDS